MESGVFSVYCNREAYWKAEYLFLTLLTIIMLGRCHNQFKLNCLKINHTLQMVFQTGLHKAHPTLTHGSTYTSHMHMKYTHCTHTHDTLNTIKYALMYLLPLHPLTTIYNVHM